MNYTDQEILYAMFILKANHYNWKRISQCQAEDEPILCRTVEMLYADLFADRAECEDEIKWVKWVLNWGYGEEE